MSLSSRRLAPVESNYTRAAGQGFVAQDVDAGVEDGHPWVTFKDPSNIRSPQIIAVWFTAATCARKSCCTPVLTKPRRMQSGVDQPVAPCARREVETRTVGGYRSHRGTDVGQRDRHQFLPHAEGAKCESAPSSGGIGPDGFRMPCSVWHQLCQPGGGRICRSQHGGYFVLCDLASVNCQERGPIPVIAAPNGTGLLRSIR